MCNCKAKIETELLPGLQAQHPEALDHQVRLTSYGTEYEEERKGLKDVPYMTADFKTLRAGEGKNGASRWKTEKMLISINFCPFCGENLREKHDA